MASNSDIYFKVTSHENDIGDTKKYQQQNLNPKTEEKPVKRTFAHVGRVCRKLQTARADD